MKRKALDTNREREKIGRSTSAVLYWNHYQYNARSSSTLYKESLSTIYNADLQWRLQLSLDSSSPLWHSVGSPINIQLIGVRGVCACFAYTR